MKEAFRLKSWAGPLTIGSFLVVAVTGILMLCHAATGPVKHLHEVVSILFVVGAVAHVAVNWQLFLAYFRKPGSVAVIAVFLIVGAISLFPHGSQSGHPPMMGIYSAMEQSSLNLVAQLVKSDPQTVKNHLESHGIRIQHDEQTISEIAEKNEKPSMEIMAIILDNTKPSANES